MRSSLSVDPVFQVVLETPAQEPGPGAPQRLVGLFRELSESRPARPAEEIEDQIWAFWVSHQDRAAEETMGAALKAMAAGALREARPLLDCLVGRYPDWAEAWNRRATLAFIEKRDADSLQDIVRALRLEPRHFGAVSSFGNICLRHGYLNEARAAFQVALSINPHLKEARMLLDNLEPLHLPLH